MQDDDFYLKYKMLLDNLKIIILSSNNRVLQNNIDPLFSENINFFVKAYLVSACTYLEAYLQDIAFDFSQEICGRINSSKTPHNFLYWRISKEVKDKDLKFAFAEINLSRKDISEEISANPYKTIKLFKLLGIDLFQSQVFVDNKDVIATVVNKRNNVIHHNDSANDISFSDVAQYIDIFIKYMEAINEVVKQAKL
ncbi:HEPN domain-containing protein [Spirulina sp. CCNP1310]|uniref:HEPN domain-containing protein n=1 Tax=Spirulina sp. CCNP1310 TaxID=3110249 RepID=UPI002B20A520|nr:HEPN domain-containing protein [Spirulina sp. CCNP1310]MEA5418000.1 HEPN domain-containing protein [Spirulina sp. CCNP1310]